jgi:hypothetical protein
MKMDWRSLGYEKEYKNGKVRWVPKQVYKTSQDEKPSS